MIYGYPSQPVTFSSTVRLLSVPICPDHLRLQDFGAADTWRGRVIRAFFWLLGAWP